MSFYYSESNKGALYLKYANLEQGHFANENIEEEGDVIENKYN